MTSRVLSLRIDETLLDRLEEHAGRRGMTVQDYVSRVLAREDFDERFRRATRRTALLAEWDGGPA
ncbi:ribbon-helix-helix protein, CopG family [Streptomyces sp. 7-21]|uniref:ribbon-helix-helix protein, CopG family n=1 Tax=Streptomyces sp. 7-21 TaxID=2802283 RepID=UPI00191E6093|nr:ribbon-helix-helix protein, CopG family [Streptomyces sp. 7-21]MBL1067527.1 ribbon-helix-helix protein, CopG family [Streptomyces sp. 7-21]